LAADYDHVVGMMRAGEIANVVEARVGRLA
jgi:hypothetical protein